MIIYHQNLCFSRVSGEVTIVFIILLINLRELLSWLVGCCKDSQDDFFLKKGKRKRKRKRKIITHDIGKRTF